jgi:hypothetical protein
MKYPVLTALIALIVTAALTYFGRIYYPKNFSPETVSFVDNWISLTMAIVFFAIGVTVVGFLLLLFFATIRKEILLLLSQ